MKEFVSNDAFTYMESEHYFTWPNLADVYHYFKIKLATIRFVLLICQRHGISVKPNSVLIAHRSQHERHEHRRPKRKSQGSNQMCPQEDDRALLFPNVKQLSYCACVGERNGCSPERRHICPQIQGISNTDNRSGICITNAHGWRNCGLQQEHIAVQGRSW